jgi:ribosome-associated protein
MRDDEDDEADEGDEVDESRRQASRRQRREAGEGGARLAKTLMALPASALGKLGLDEDLRAVVDRARAVTAHIARRRAERSLAGELRRAELGDLETRLTNVLETGAAAPRLFKLAEQWRERLIADSSAAAEFPGGPQPELHALVHKARRERDTGKPPGAARALFRHVHAVLDADSRAAAGESAAAAAPAADDEREA